MRNQFDGLLNHTIFCLWTGEELLSENRIRALWSIIKNTGSPVVYVTANTVHNWILPDHPFHEGYKFLSSTHKSDYLRCYLMHHFGGGYTDIKMTTKNWYNFFERLQMSKTHMALGYRELPHGLPHLNTLENMHMQSSYADLIGLCAFIFKRQSIITKLWYDQLHQKLDTKLKDLMQHPAKINIDQKGLLLPDNTTSEYPLRWAEILGEILHPILFEYRNDLIQDEINPLFHSYR